MVILKVISILEAHKRNIIMVSKGYLNRLWTTLNKVNVTSSNPPSPFSCVDMAKNKKIYIYI
jgi:hypothetical protein